jgi:tetratricopeptide (TPR) repeat protein
VAIGLGQEREVKNLVYTVGVLALFLAVLLPVTARAENLTISPEAKAAMDKIYEGDPDAALRTAQSIEQARPDDPEGYLLEAEATWWKRYCAACEIKYGMVDAWKREKNADDASYLTLAARVTSLAEQQLAKSETAEMHVYAGMGWALQVRVYGLREENRSAARAAVKARAEMIRALQIDPGMADATAALGIYNYFVDTLPSIVKMLRFFMGIPGGNKEQGIEQMRVGMDNGILLAVEVRYILARNLRTYDHDYEQALKVTEPLLARYPRSPMFQLLAGNLNAELGRNAQAGQFFHSALQTSIPDTVCEAKIREIAKAFLGTLH